MAMTNKADSVVVLDFETSGMSPKMGSRSIEVGAVKLLNGQVVDQFQSLMNPQISIDSFIQSFTGISNLMLKASPSSEEVMTEFHQFIGDSHLVAHNASFDKSFLDAEFARLGLDYRGTFACSVLLSRRIFQDAPNHKLETLIRYRHIKHDGTFHRALADATMTADLWLDMLNDIGERFNCWDLPFEFVDKLTKVPKKNIASVLEAYNHSV